MKLSEPITNHIVIMGANYIPSYRRNNSWILGLEKHLLEKHYNFLEAEIKGAYLFCRGTCQPCDDSIMYTYLIKFTPGKHPTVLAVKPKIEYHEDIHMYPQDNSLCLYFPKDFSWTANSHLFNTIVPWTHEWFVFYELYQIYGKWLHPSVTHNNSKLKI